MALFNFKSAVLFSAIISILDWIFDVIVIFDWSFDIFDEHASGTWKWAIILAFLVLSSGIFSTIEVLNLDQPVNWYILPMYVIGLGVFHSSAFILCSNDDGNASLYNHSFILCKFSEILIESTCGGGLQIYSIIIDDADLINYLSVVSSVLILGYGMTEAIGASEDLPTRIAVFIFVVSDFTFRVLSLSVFMYKFALAKYLLPVGIWAVEALLFFVASHYFNTDVEYEYELLPLILAYSIFTFSKVFSVTSWIVDQESKWFAPYEFMFRAVVSASLILITVLMKPVTTLPALLWIILGTSGVLSMLLGLYVLPKDLSFNHGYNISSGTGGSNCSTPQPSNI